MEIVRALLVLVVILSTLPVRPAVAAGAQPGESARCNGRASGELESRVQVLEAHPPADTGVDSQFVQLSGILGDEAVEDNILHAACTRETDLMPLIADLRASEALAYLAESDLTRREFTKSCPTALEPVTAGFIAAAWRELVLASPDSGPTPRSITDLVPQVTARAAAVHLTLPSFADASNYWMTTVQQAGQRAASACPE